MNDREQADASSEPYTVDAKPVEISDDEWSREKTIDELLRNLASVQQTAVDESGQIIIVRKYQSLCRRLGRFIPVAEPTPEYLIHLSDLKPEVRGALEKIHHPELRRLLAHQAVLRLSKPLGSNHILALDVNSMSN